MLFWPLLIIGLAILGLFLAGPPSEGVMDGDRSQAQLVYLTVMAVGMIAAAAGRIVLRGGRRALTHTAVWVGAIAGLTTAFALRDQATIVVNDIRGELMPSVALSHAEGEAELRRAWDGHYRATAEVNGVEMRLLIDTGASMVLIPYEDVADLGINPANLDFSIQVTTANGKSSVAPIRLSSIKIGPIAVFDIDAAVAQPGRLKTGLLGMTFIDQLSETSFQGDRLYLRQRQGARFARFRSPPPTVD
ncbi:MAG TPA: TIGR02281 family clan AA aspartic protease [Thermohalobaculum sp.]|nr:TIGR02281 family clan AA aspartic protease [Thermohalobaculum sp.]